MGTLIKEADLHNPVFYYNHCTFVIKKNSKIKKKIRPTYPNFFDLRYLNTTIFFFGLMIPERSYYFCFSPRAVILKQQLLNENQHDCQTSPFYRDISLWDELTSYRCLEMHLKLD